MKVSSKTDDSADDTLLEMMDRVMRDENQPFLEKHYCEGTLPYFIPSRKGWLRLLSVVRPDVVAAKQTKPKAAKGLTSVCTNS